MSEICALCSVCSPYVSEFFLNKFIRFSSTLVSKKCPKYFPWKHFWKTLQVSLKYQNAFVRQRIFVPFFQLDFPERKGHWGKAEAIAVQKFMPIELFKYCLLTTKAFQSHTVLIWHWNGLEVQYGTDFCCCVTCFQPNMVLLQHSLLYEISCSLLTFYNQSKY